MVKQPLVLNPQNDGVCNYENLCSTKGFLTRFLDGFKNNRMNIDINIKFRINSAYDEVIRFLYVWVAFCAFGLQSTTLRPTAAGLHGSPCSGLKHVGIWMYGFL